MPVPPETLRLDSGPGNPSAADGGRRRAVVLHRDMLGFGP